MCGAANADESGRRGKFRPVDGSGFVRGASHDREGVNTPLAQGAKGIINEPMSGQGPQPGKARAADLDVEVPAFASPGMAGVASAVVHDLDRFRRQCGHQRCAQFIGRHVVSPGWKSIAAELMQKRSPVGCGPSGNTWPRWEPQFRQRTSTRTMPWLASATRSTTSAFTGSQ